MDADSYVMSETLRQSGTLNEANGMARAVACAGVYGYDQAKDLITMCALNVKGNVASAARYRQTPVTFANGSLGLAAHLIPVTINNLYRCIPEFTLNGKASVMDADLICREFLDIHPFQDGNGRVASILRNWLLDTLTDPSPLPHYYK